MITSWGSIVASHRRLVVVAGVLVFVGRGSM